MRDAAGAGRAPSGRAAARRAAAVRAENELKRTIDWAASQQAEERAALYAARSSLTTSATSAPATAPTPTTRRSLTVTFTEQELNAAFEKWETAYDWRDAYGAYISDPRIVLHEGRLIVAGDVKDMGTL